MQTVRVPRPSGDLRWCKVETTLLEYGYESHALIEVLHAVQEAFGYLDQTALCYVSAALQLPPSVVYGVATFYHLFTLTPPAEHTCVVCTGTACHIKGATKILEALDCATGLQPGDQTPGGEVALQEARCVGFCSPAPVVIFDDEPIGSLTPHSVVEQVRRWMSHAT